MAAAPARAAPRSRPSTTCSQRCEQGDAQARRREREPGQREQEARRARRGARPAPGGTRPRRRARFRAPAPGSRAARRTRGADARRGVVAELGVASSDSIFRARHCSALRLRRGAHVDPRSIHRGGAESESACSSPAAASSARAIACALVERGVRDVCVVDLDLAGTYASSELNAGGARATWWQEVNIAACRDTIAFFDEHAEEVSLRASAATCGCTTTRALRARARAARAAGAPRRCASTCSSRARSRAALPAARPQPRRARRRDLLAAATGCVNPERGARACTASARSPAARASSTDTTSRAIEVAEREPGRRRVERVHVVEVAEGRSRRRERARASGILTQHRVPRRGERRPPVRCARRSSSTRSAPGARSSRRKLGVRDFSVPVRRQIAMVDVRARDLARRASTCTPAA